MESWRHIWREGFAPSLPTNGLMALSEALITDDTRLLQGANTCPPPLMCVKDWPVEGADAIGFVGWMESNLANVGEVEEFFARACFECDKRLQEPAACRWFLNYWDDTPRAEVFRELLSEVKRTLAERSKAD